jgi:crossover junction endodeoxyribonuclease RuvC
MKQSANSNPATIILGVDPGTRVSGYGIIGVQNNRYELIDYGCIRPPAEALLSERYLIIFESLEELIDSYHPDAVVVETQYIQKNVQSAMKLGMARGVAMIAAKKKRIPVFGYAPTEAKRAVTGNGRASKHQVQGMVQRLLNLESPPHPEDAADALAIAICHAHMAEHLKKKHEI